MDNTHDVPSKQVEASCGVLADQFLSREALPVSGESVGEPEPLVRSQTEWQEGAGQLPMKAGSSWGRITWYKWV
jgi:hypothetical protein